MSFGLAWSLYLDDENEDVQKELESSCFSDFFLLILFYNIIKKLNLSKMIYIFNGIKKQVVECLLDKI